LISKKIALAKLLEELKSHSSKWMKTRYSALSGLNGSSFTQHTGLHPALTNSALSGLSEVSKGRTGSDNFFNPKLELINFT
jgi:hypothetical protein